MIHLTERLPKSTYEDHDGTEDETVLSKIIDNSEDQDAFPKINNGNNQISIQNSVLKSRKDSLPKSGKYSDYSFDSQLGSKDRSTLSKRYSHQYNLIIYFTFV